MQELDSKEETGTPDSEKPGKQKIENVPGKWSSAWILIPCLYLFCVSLATWFVAVGTTEPIPYSTFIKNVQEGKVSNLLIDRRQITGKYKSGKFKMFTTNRVEDPDLIKRLNQKNIDFEGKPEGGFWDFLPWLIGPILFFVFLSMLTAKAAGKDGMGFGIGAIAKNKAKVYMENRVRTSFQDVAGLLEAKEELSEVIGFLKEPAKYNRLGGHLPKGILLVGPPGTGKTLLARAVAGEAGVPFFSISGSEFVELFVGVGAARVRDLFEQAEKNAPCIIFIDELDALGRSRGIAGMPGSHDEKEQTLNQLLVEMDGFDPRQGVVLLAATNRPEILDAALLRAGRFDRHILVDRPDKLDRLQILQVHMRNVVCDPSVSVEEIASSTPGFTGADLANLVNEASLLATRRGAEAVESKDFFNALERVVAGLEKRNRLLNPRERKVVAYHETGHALTALALPGTDPVQKISIIPRGVGALGYTMQTPTEDRFLMSREELRSKLAVLLGGRAAEMIIFDEISTGAADDLMKATDIARSMVTRYGMVDSLGPVCYEGETSPFLPAHFTDAKHLSDETMKEIDAAVRNLVSEALDHAIEILKERRTLLENAANLLLQKESLTQEDLQQLAAADTKSAKLPEIDNNTQEENDETIDTTPPALKHYPQAPITIFPPDAQHAPDI